MGYNGRLKVFYPLVEAVNRIDSRLFIFLLLCLNLLSFVPYSNEEAYFSLAKQYADPSWIPHSFTFTEWVGTRFLFQNIAGFALRFMSFEQLAFWGRLMNFLLYAFPLALIFKQLKINNLGIWVILQLYILNVNTQSFFGMEWIFLGFESKTLAYVFVLYGFHSLLRGKYHFSALFAAAASYFHILVGGWFFVLTVIYAFTDGWNLKLAVKTGLIYLAAVLPFILYLVGYVADSGPVIHGVNIDWVYSFFRNTHHTAPMHTDGAMTKVFPRIVVSFLLLLLTIFYFRRSDNRHIRQLNRIAMIALCIIFIGLAVTFVDTGGHLLKYYLFRIAAIGAFSYYLLIFLFLREECRKRSWRMEVGVLLVIAVFSFFKIERAVSKLISPDLDRDLIALADFVREHTAPEDVYMFYDREDLSFSRRARREAWVMFKFDPGGGEKIYEWYVRAKAKERLKEDIAYLDAITEKYRLDYLISQEKIEDVGRVKEVYHNNKYYLYEIVRGDALRDD